MILKILLTLIHFIIYLKTICETILQKCSVFVNCVFCDEKPSRYSYEKDSQGLQKLPVHLGFIFTEQELCIRDISRMLFWCFALGVPQVSVYDFRGTLKRHKKDIEEHTKKELRKHSSTDAPSAIFINNSYKNNPKGSSSVKLFVNILCAQDGRKSIVDITRCMAHSVTAGQMKVSDIDANFVDDLFHEQSGILDPDVVIKFGPVESLLGYLPWQTRLTEILSVPSHQNISYSTFYSTLKSYGSIKQRFGK